MQNCKELSEFLAKSIGAPHNEEEVLMAPTSNSTFIYYLTNNYSYGLWRYSPFCIGLVLSSSGIKCMSPKFLFGGTYFGRPREYVVVII